MLSDVLYDAVRRRLHDTDSPVQRGVFWDDRQIELALNAAQMDLCNLWLSSSNFYILSQLLVEIVYAPKANNTVVYTLPNDYMHYLNGCVNENKMCRIHIGAINASYNTARHSAIYINNNIIYFVDDGNELSGGKLWYYKYPNVIPLPGNNLNKSFEDNIYMNYIVEQAIVILGMKETQTQREFKINKNNIVTNQSLPVQYFNYNNNGMINGQQENDQEVQRRDSKDRTNR